MIFRSLWLVALLLPAAAQEEKSAKPSTTGIQIKLLAEAAPADLGKVFMQLAEDEKSAAVDLPTRFLSNPIVVSTRTMILKTSAKQIPLCTIKLPEAGKAFAIILVTAKPTGYTPIIVRTDDPAFKEGDVFFVNRSEKVILGKLGKSALVLNPGETTKARPTGAVDDAYYDIAFAIREPQGDKLISSSRWPIDKNLRSYVFFFTSAQGKTSFRAVDEYMEVNAP